MESKYTVDRYTFSDGSWVELEDRITPLNEVEMGKQYLSCMVNIRQGDNGLFTGDACFVRVLFSHPKNWEAYRGLMNEMMTQAMGQEARCAYVDIIAVTADAVTVQHADGTVGLIPIRAQVHLGNLTVH